MIIKQFTLNVDIIKPNVIIFYGYYLKIIIVKVLLKP